MSEVRVWTRAGDSPTWGEICEVLELPQSGEFLYFTATAAQQGIRGDQLEPSLPRPVRQLVRDPNSARESVVFYFPQALRVLLELTDTRVVRRLDERLSIRRALRRIAGGDSGREHQLLHDLGTWQQAVRQAAEQGIELAEMSSSDFRDPDAAEVLRDLQAALDESLAAEGELLFEDAARKYVLEAEPPSRVVLEGFTIITPLQTLLLETWSKSATVDVVVPYREEQAHGFEAVERSYASWWEERREWPQPETAAGTTGDLFRVQSGLFGDEADSDTLPSDDSILVREFGSRQREVEHCVGEIKGLLDAGTAGPKDLAIVVLDLAGYRSLIQEEATRQGLALTVRTPPRMLLLTPVGRFVLDLFEIWRPDDQALAMDGEQFQEILASGWLGAGAQGSVDQFRMVRAQLFRKCSSEGDWNGSLRFLERLIAGETAYAETIRADSREPALSVDPALIELWRDAVEQVVELCRALFEDGERSISEHIRRLSDALGTLPTNDLMDIEKEVIGRLGEALEEQAQASALDMDTEEFGTLLLGLAQEREEEGAESTDEELRAEDPPEQPGEVWITTLRGIDGVSRRFTFMLGVDDLRMPMPFQESWPFTQGGVDDHIRSERYLFLSAIRAALERLWLSYSRTDSRGARAASVYLDHLGSRYGLEISRPGLEEMGEEQPPPAPSPVPVERSEVDLRELAQFGLCPFRYKLERLAPIQRVYRSEFQVDLLAGSTWLDVGLTALEDDRVEGRTKDALVGELTRALESVRGYLGNRIRGITEQQLTTMERYLRTRVIWFDIWRPPARFLAADRDATSWQLTVNGRAVEVSVVPPRHAVQQGGTSYGVWNDLFRQEWLLASSQEPQGSPTVLDGTALFETRAEAWEWLTTAQRRAWWKDEGDPELQESKNTAAALAAAAEVGQFPRQPGKQCDFCSAQDACLGLPDPRITLLEEAESGLAPPETEQPLATSLGRGSLTSQQEQIVERVTKGGLTVVSAGAGSGKTHTMVASIIELVESHSASMDQFVLITFTNKAADELRARIEAALRERAEQADEAERARWLEQQERLSGAHIGTIHGFCGAILREFGYGLRIPRTAKRTLSRSLFLESLDSAVDDAFAGRTPVDESGLLGGDVPVVAEIDWDAHELQKNAADLADHCQRVGVEINEMAVATADQESDDGKGFRLAFADLLADAKSRYDERKRVDGIVDAHDLLLRTRDLIQSDTGEAVVEGLASRYGFLFIDEFQDTDPIQAEVVDHLEQALQAVLLVGDLKQSIYGFRAAEPTLLAQFAEKHHHRDGEDGSPLPLNVARRPTKQLLDTQNAFFEGLGGRGYPELADPLQSEERPLEPEHPLRPLVVDPDSEPSTIAAYIRDLIGTEFETKDGVRPIEAGDIAILARTNYAVERCEREVTAELGGAPAVLDDTGGLFFARPEIVSTYRVLRLLLEPNSDAVLSTALETPYFTCVDAGTIEADLLARGPGDRTLAEWFEREHSESAAKLQELRGAARTEPVPQILARLFDEFDIRAFYRRLGHVRAIENLEKLRNLAGALFGEDQALTLQIYVEYLGQAIVRRWSEHDADTGSSGEPLPRYVRAMTIHRAKGLEFPIVLIPSVGFKLLNDDNDPWYIVHDDKSLDLDLPTRSDVDTRTEQFTDELVEGRRRRVQEEMRLLYVAMTRAEQCIIAFGGGAFRNEPGSQWYSWKDELRAARSDLEPHGALYLDAAGPPSALTL